MMPHCSKLSKLGSSQREERRVSPWKRHREAACCDATASPGCSQPPALHLLPSTDGGLTTREAKGGLSSIVPTLGLLWDDPKVWAGVNATRSGISVSNNSLTREHLLVDRALHVVNHGETTDGFQKVVLRSGGRATESKVVQQVRGAKTDKTHTGVPRVNISQGTQQWHCHPATLPPPRYEMPRKTQGRAR